MLNVDLSGEILLLLSKHVGGYCSRFCLFIYLFHLSIGLCTGSLKKLWMDWDEIFKVTPYWAKLGMIIFWTHNSFGKGNIFR